MPSEHAQGDVELIRALLERWADAARREDLDAIRAHHDVEMLMFDVPPPFLSRGLDAYMETWRLFFSNVERPILFSLEDIEITAGSDVAFATAKGKCVNIDRVGRREPLEFRLTVGLKKIGRESRILHEHHSLPSID
jgi:ketosteroid isomerase-like protein